MTYEITFCDSDLVKTISSSAPIETVKREVERQEGIAIKEIIIVNN